MQKLEFERAAEPPPTSVVLRGRQKAEVSLCVTVGRSFFTLSNLRWSYQCKGAQKCFE